MAQNKTLMYVGIGLGVLVVGGVACMLLKPKNNDEKFGGGGSTGGSSGGGNTYSGGGSSGGGSTGGGSDKTTAGQVIQFGLQSGLFDKIVNSIGGGNNQNTIQNVPDSVPFVNSQQGNCFRGWINDNYPAYAQQIDLDRTGSYDNSYITTAYAKYGSTYDTFLNGRPIWYKSACGY